MRAGYRDLDTAMKEKIADLSAYHSLYYSQKKFGEMKDKEDSCLLYTSPSPRDYAASRMPSSA